MLDFYGHVISQVGKVAMKLFDERNGVAYAIKKVWITERNMLRTGGYLTANILKHNFTRHDPENAVIHRHNGTVATPVLASPAGFRGANNSVTIARNNEMSVFLHCGQS